ncbi:MAG: hypothetical protein ABEN55_17180, partial [Bradymonadaceae bacterium]
SQASTQSSSPEIVANTGGAQSGTSSGEAPSGASGGDYINRVELRADKPSEIPIPTSWSVVDR